MSLPSYTRSDRARRGRMAARRVPRVVRFCVVFFGLFAVACFFWGGDMLAYAQEGSFLMFGLSVLFCGLFALASVSIKRVPRRHKFEFTHLGKSKEILTDPLTDPYYYSPGSPGYVFKAKD